MKNRQTDSMLLAGAILAGTGGITVGLAAIGQSNLFATVIGLMLIATGVVVMFGHAAFWNAVWKVAGAPFRAYTRLYRSQWQTTDEGKHEQGRH